MISLSKLEKETIGLRGILRKDTETDFRNLFLFFLSKNKEETEYFDLMKNLHKKPDKSRDLFRDYSISNDYSGFLVFRSVFSSFHLPFIHTYIQY